MSRRHPAAGAIASRRITLTLAAVLVVAGCGADPVVVYRDSAVSALEATLSEARTAELAARLWVAGRSTHPLAVVVVRDSDTGVGSEVSWFEQQQPPGRGGDRTRERTVDALDAAASAVQSVRIALNRSDREGTRTALAELRSSCSGLESLAEELG
ncbi:MAG: hypothetical protein ACJ711_05745 [Ornithinibacter sp.]